jgi:CHAT domain-containing protein
MTNMGDGLFKSINISAKVGIASSYAAQGNYGDAVPLLEDILTSPPKNIDLFPLVMGSNKAGLLSQKKSFDYAFSLLQAAASTRAGDAADKFVQRFISNTGNISELVREEQDLSNQFVLIEKLLIEEMSRNTKNHQSAETQLRRRLLDLEGRRKTVGDRLIVQAPNYIEITGPPAIKAEDIQSVLADDEALVAILPGSKSYVWLVTRNATHWAEIPVSTAVLNNQVKALRASLTAGKFDLLLAHRMYRQLFSPIIDKLSGKKRLSIYASGALSSIPLQILVTKNPAGKGYKNVDWMVKSFAITNVASVYSFMSLRTTVPHSRAPKPMIAFADPVFDQSLSQRGKQDSVISIAQRGITSFYRGEQADFSLIGRSLGRARLPGTRREVLAVAKSVNANAQDLYLGLAASPTTVRNAKLSDYRIVYFATHALVAGDIEKFIKAKAEPAIALTFPKNPTSDNNGLLFASDVAQLKMDADWTVLSACNTAAGDSTGAEALSGLARAFIYAGSRSLLVSHWQVDDTRTARLMTNLFNIAQANPTLSHGEALQQAELRLLETAQKDEDANPRLWAPFVVIGEPAKNKPTARK